MLNKTIHPFIIITIFNNKILLQYQEEEIVLRANNLFACLCSCCLLYFGIGVLVLLKA